MTTISRRTLMKGVGAAATLSMIGTAAQAEDKVKVGFIFLGPIGDYGWTWAHNKGREAIESTSKTLQKTPLRFRCCAIWRNRAAS